MIVPHNIIVDIYLSLIGVESRGKSADDNDTDIMAWNAYGDIIWKRTFSRLGTKTLEINWRIMIQWWVVGSTRNNNIMAQFAASATRAMEVCSCSVEETTWWITSRYLYSSLPRGEGLIPRQTSFLFFRCGSDRFLFFRIDFYRWVESDNISMVRFDFYSFGSDSIDRFVRHKKMQYLVRILFVWTSFSRFVRYFYVSDWFLCLERYLWFRLDSSIIVNVQ